ncbi:unnamed protein product [Amoebophrya sp. A120]|nr:unnamed protein product [Amoebophrya sp. A120]|eukprot:GSA120T00011273001.1
MFMCLFFVLLHSFVQENTNKCFQKSRSRSVTIRRTRGHCTSLSVNVVVSYLVHGLGGICWWAAEATQVACGAGITTQYSMLVHRLDGGGSIGRAMPGKGGRGSSSISQNREVASRVVAVSA